MFPVNSGGSSGCLSACGVGFSVKSSLSKISVIYSLLVEHSLVASFSSVSSIFVASLHSHVTLLYRDSILQLVIICDGLCQNLKWNCRSSDLHIWVMLVGVSGASSKNLVRPLQSHSHVIGRSISHFIYIWNAHRPTASGPGFQYLFPVTVSVPISVCVSEGFFSTLFQ